MPFKFTMLFNFGGSGFSESWYYTGGAPGGGAPLLSGDFKELASARALMSGQFVTLMGARLSDVDNPRLTQSQFLFAKEEGVDRPDTVTNAWMALVRGQLGRGRRQLWLRGIPDDAISFDKDTQRFLPQGTLAGQITNYEKILKAKPWALRVIQSAAGAGAANQAILAIAPSVTGGAVVLTGPAVADPTKPIIVSAFKKPLSFLNGTYLPRTGYVVDGAGKANLLHKALSTFDALGYVGGASLRPVVATYLSVQSVTLEFPRERRVGRAFFVARGRRPRAR